MGGNSGSTWLVSSLQERKCVFEKYNAIEKKTNRADTSNHS